MRQRWCLALATALPLASALAACPEPVGPERLRESVAAADEAFAAADADAYRAADDAARRGLLCVDSLVSTELVAALHRTSGVRAFLDRDIDRAEVRFLAARRLDAAFSWPDGLVPSSHPLRAAYQARDPAAVIERDAPPPREGLIAFDGRLGSGRPAGVPTVFQHLDRSGRPLLTALLEPYQEVPAYTVAERRRVRPASVTAAVAGVAAVALYSAALGTRATYDDLSTPYDRLDPLRSQILALTVSSGVAAAIGVGAGVAAVAPRGEGR